MSHGLRIWGSDGSLLFDTGTITWRIVLSEIVSFASSSASTKTFSVPGCNPSNSVAFVLPINNETGNATTARQLEAQMGTDVAYCRNFLGGYPDRPSISWATMRLIVMRWN